MKRQELRGGGGREASKLRGGEAQCEESVRKQVATATANRTDSSKQRRSH